MKTIYVIDACALIDVARNYNMSKKSFSHIWATLDALIQNGELVSSSEIMDELKDDDLNWHIAASRLSYRQLFVSVTPTPSVMLSPKKLTAKSSIFIKSLRLHITSIYLLSLLLIVGTRT